MKGDSATIEVIWRPGGRPSGSKNKPKPPLIITSQSFQHLRRSKASDCPSLGTIAKKGDDAMIKVVRRPRDRPSGSKNKLKPPLIITKDSEPAMSHRRV